MTEIDIPAAMERAADIIMTEGSFGKGRFKTEEGCYCVLGAYTVALGVDPDFDCLDDGLTESGAYEAFHDGWEHLNETVKPLGFDVVQQMNDAPETTADQMAGVLRETATRLRGAVA